MQQGHLETHVITGASSGIGRELAIQLARPGRKIWLIGRDEERLAEVAAQIEGRGAVSRWKSLDLADMNASSAFLDEEFPAGKPVHSVYLSAAVSLFGEVQDTQLEDWQDLYKTNLLSAVQWTHHFYKHMVEAKEGRIVLVASLASYAGYPTATAYATMKAGLLGLYRSLWYEGKEHGVFVHISAPGYVKTGIYQHARFRKTSYEDTMSLIHSLGFGMIEADVAARHILEAIDSGKNESSFPAYAMLMKWAAPRMPWFAELVHQRLLKNFRRTS